MLAQMFLESAKFGLLNAGLAKQALCHIFLHNSTKKVTILYVFIAISARNPAQNFIKLNFENTKEFTTQHIKTLHKTAMYNAS